MTKPPLYTRLPLHKSVAQSMVFGVGTNDEGTFQRSPPELQRPVFTPRCEHPPLVGELHSYNGLENVTTMQAERLGIILRTQQGASEPLRTGHLVLWRSGRYAVCKDAGKQELVYGAEWVIAFLLQDPVPSTSLTIDALAAQVARGQLLEIGVVANGVQTTDAAEQESQELLRAWAQSSVALLQRFSTLREQRSPEQIVPSMHVPIGVATPQ